MFRNLTVFQTVADCGTISGAAQRLNMTQSAVSKIMGQLEMSYGGQLLNRHARGVSLTALGEILLLHANDVCVREMDTRQNIAALQGGRVHLSIGAGAQWSLSILPNVLRQFRQEYSGFSADVTVGTRDILLPKLLSGELDMALTQGDDTDLPDVEKHHLATVPIHVVAANQHALHRSSNVDANDLTKYNWVNFRSMTPSRSDFRQQWPPSVPQNAQVIFNTSSLILGIQIVAESDCLMGLPQGVLDVASQFNVLPLPGLTPVTSLTGYLWIRRAVKVLPIIEALSDCLLSSSSKIEQNRKYDSHPDIDRA